MLNQCFRTYFGNSLAGWMAVRSFLVVVLCGCFIENTNAQDRIITAGFQFKPIFSSSFFRTGPVDETINGVDFHLDQRSGFCLGMVVRKGITNTISFETGINLVKRNFGLSVTVPDSAVDESSTYSITSYEVPLQGLVFIQLSDRIFMDVALGFSLDFYPNDFKTYGDNYVHFSAREKWVSTALLANIGWEYRTEKSGFIYLGASFHRPFDFIYYSYILYPNDMLPTAEFQTQIQGNYLTFDIRYFFPSKPEKMNKRKKRNDPRQG